MSDNDTQEPPPPLGHPDWAAFRDAGLLWWVNRQLHLFGWAIAVELSPSGEEISGYPCQTTFRGFSPAAEHEGFLKLGEFVKTTPPWAEDA